MLKYVLSGLTALGFLLGSVGVVDATTQSSTAGKTSISSSEFAKKKKKGSKSKKKGSKSKKKKSKKSTS